jgi:hypothetical protein
MKSDKMKSYPSFLAWKKDQNPKNQRLAAKLAKLVKETAPEFTATVKWGQGCWTFNNAPKIFIHAEPDHLQFGFFAGSKMKDPDKLLVGKGKHVRHVKVFTPKDIQIDKFVALIEQIL